LAAQLVQINSLRVILVGPTHMQSSENWVDEATSCFYRFGNTEFRFQESRYRAAPQVNANDMAVFID
jgi:hypothetical protein